MKPSFAMFLNSVSPNERRCPLCRKYHSVTKIIEERIGFVFNDMYVFLMHCDTENVDFRKESLFDKHITEMYFERRDAL